MAEFVCGAWEKNPNDLSACKNLPEYRDTGYCVLHFPGEEKREDFEQVKKDKLEQEDYDFRGAIFTEGTSDFRRCVFDGNADFIGATFVGKADFTEAQFSGKRTYFSRAQFSAAETSFSDAQFGCAETSFQAATFAKEVDFTGVTFGEKITFWGTQGNPVFGPGAWVQFDRPRIEKPELLTFNTVLLHPGWFINADVRKVDFTEVKWYGMPGGPEGTLDEELSTLEEHKVEARHTLLAQACRRLSANAEENREYPLANEFHYWSMDARRKQGWRSLGLIGSLYWALSGYGVRARRALGVLLSIAVVFAVLYMLLGPNALQVSSASNPVQAMEHAGQAVVYSLSTMARLNPEPKPNPGLFQFLVTIEGILGPLQIALLALAIRRKVMR